MEVEREALLGRHKNNLEKHTSQKIKKERKKGNRASKRKSGKESKRESEAEEYW